MNSVNFTPSSNLLSFEGVPTELQYLILRQCSRRDLNQVALVSRHFNYLSRESNFLDSRNFTICSNIYLGKQEKSVYVFLENISHNLSGVISFYVSPCGSRFKLFQIKDEQKNNFINRKLYVINIELLQNPNSCSKCEIKEMSFSELIDTNIELQNAGFMTRSLSGEFRFRSTIEFFQQHLDYHLKFQPFNQEFIIKKSLTDDNLDYTCECNYNCTDQRYTRETSNKLTLRKGEEIITTLTINEGPIENFVIIGSFLVLLAAGNIQIFDKKTLRFIRNLNSKNKYHAMQIDQKRECIYAITANGIEVYSFSNYQNPISTTPKTKLHCAIYTIIEFTKVFFKVLLRTIQNPKNIFRDKKFTLLICGSLLLGALVTSSSPNEIILKVSLLFFTTIFIRSYQEF